MGTDIRKPRISHVGIQRIRDSTTVSTSTSSLVDGRGGGGNDLDEEERAGDEDYPPNRALLLDEDSQEGTQIVFREDQIRHIEETEGHRDSENEFSESDDEEETRTLKAWARQAWKRTSKWVKHLVVRAPSTTTRTVENPQVARAGITYVQHFKAPRGKRNYHLEIF